MLIASCGSSSTNNGSVHGVVAVPVLSSGRVSSGSVSNGSVGLLCSDSVGVLCSGSVGVLCSDSVGVCAVAVWGFVQWQCG